VTIFGVWIWVMSRPMVGKAGVGTSNPAKGMKKLEDWKTGRLE